MNALVASSDLASDVTGAEALIERHQVNSRVWIISGVYTGALFHKFGKSGNSKCLVSTQVVPQRVVTTKSQ